MTASPTPRRHVSHRVASTDGVTLALHDLGGDGPPLLLCHATGFHGMVWAPVAAHLGASAHCWAVDFRGHGDSDLPMSGSLAWQGMADDVLAVADGVDGDVLFGAGHSMGGVALLLAEQLRPGLFCALWCYEPIVFPPVEAPWPAGGNPMAAAARRRKAVFPDRATAIANYAAKPPLGGVHPEALEMYVDHGFWDLPDGTVELKCAPETEAQVFEGGMNHETFVRLGEVACPTTVVASGDGGPPSRAATLVAEALPYGRLERMAEFSHFGPMEEPKATARSIASQAELARRR